MTIAQLYANSSGQVIIIARHASKDSPMQCISFCHLALCCTMTYTQQDIAQHMSMACWFPGVDINCMILRVTVKQRHVTKLVTLHSSGQHCEAAQKYLGHRGQHKDWIPCSCEASSCSQYLTLCFWICHRPNHSTVAAKCVVLQFLHLHRLL